MKDFQHEKRNFVSPSGHVMFYLLYKHQWNTKPFQWNSFFLAKGAIYYVAIATVIFSHVKIPCYFHVCRYHVFARKLTWYFIGGISYSKIYYYCYTAYCIVLLFLFIYFKIICCSSEYKTLIVTRITTSLWGGGKGAIKINYTILLYCTNNSFSISF